MLNKMILALVTLGASSAMATTFYDAKCVAETLGVEAEMQVDTDADRSEIKYVVGVNDDDTIALADQIEGYLDEEQTLHLETFGDKVVTSNSAADQDSTDQFEFTTGLRMTFGEGWGDQSGTSRTGDMNCIATAAE